MLIGTRALVRNEFRRGDFFDLKNLNLSQDDVSQPPFGSINTGLPSAIAMGSGSILLSMWSWEVSRNFCGAIHEYAESIGKENFLLIGEVTGGAEMARNYLEIFGRNIFVRG
jgi:hypothetical protein